MKLPIIIFLLIFFCNAQDNTSDFELDIDGLDVVEEDVKPVTWVHEMPIAAQDLRDYAAEQVSWMDTAEAFLGNDSELNLTTINGMLFYA